MTAAAYVPPEEEKPVLLEILAQRVGLTEGQLYTLVIGLLALLLVAATGLPGAGRLETDAPVAPVAPTTAPPTTEPAP